MLSWFLLALGTPSRSTPSHPGEDVLARTADDPRMRTLRPMAMSF